MTSSGYFFCPTNSQKCNKSSLTGKTTSSVLEQMESGNKLNGLCIVWLWWLRHISQFIKFVSFKGPIWRVGTQKSTFFLQTLTLWHCSSGQPPSHCGTTSPVGNGTQKSTFLQVDLFIWYVCTSLHRPVILMCLWRILTKAADRLSTLCEAVEGRWTSSNWLIDSSLQS